MSAGPHMREEREAKLAALRRDIAEGLASGEAEPLDMRSLKARARKKRNAAKHDARAAP
jgi:antitoxin ParD1/3/4